MTATNSTNTTHNDTHASGPGLHDAERLADRAADAIGSEFRALMADVQHLVQGLAHDADPAIAQLRLKVESTLASARRALAEGKDCLVADTRGALAQSDRYVRQQPWQALGIAAVAGLVAGIALSRR